MTEFIGSRISLISKRDIRYVGTLHEISSENSTVALENVTSYGTEGRRPDEEVPPNLDNTYEYIVFRGSDVKDLRIEEVPKEPKKAPQIPDDPAILGSTRRPSGTVSGPKSPESQPYPPHAPGDQADPSPQIIQKQNQPNRHQPPPFQQPPYAYHPGPQRFGPGGPAGFPGVPNYGFQNLPYGPPPGWFPPHSFPQHMGPGHFNAPGLSVGPAGQQQSTASGQSASPHDVPPAHMPVGPIDARTADEMKPVATVKLPSSSSTPVPHQIPHEMTPKDLMSGSSSALAAPEPALGMIPPEKSVSKQKLVPAIPLSPVSKKATSLNGTSQSTVANAEDKRTPGAPKSLEEANRDARAAVAAAMAKLPSGDKSLIESGGALESVTKAISELKTSEGSKPIRGNRGNRSGLRDGRDNGRRVEVPQTDFDFETANAKFNKHDLVKEAIATGSPVEDSNHIANDNITANSQGNTRRGNESGAGINVGFSYNKSSSFFDDISSEIKDRAEGNESRHRIPGREFRNEERQKNLETFGQGSVDSNYRHGRGRGRGRGYTRGGRGMRPYGTRSSNRGRPQFATVEGQPS